MARVTSIAVIAAPLLSSRELVTASLLRQPTRTVPLASSLGAVPVISRWGLQTATTSSLGMCLRDMSAQLQMGYPPVIVGHGAGALLAQKYVESFPARGMVFINPWTIDTVKRVLTEWPRQFPTGWALAEKTNSLRGLLSDPTFVKAFMLSDLDLSPDIINSEPGLPIEFLHLIVRMPPRYDRETHVPALVMASTDDPVVTSDDVVNTMLVYESETMELANHMAAKDLTGGHYPMLSTDDRTRRAFEDILVEWLDENGF